MIQFGLMNRGQFPVGGDAAQHWAEMLEQVRWAEKMRFDSIMKGSHYTTHPLSEFQQVPFLSRIMAEAPSLRLIAGVVLLPLHKPLDIAEQFANIDVTSVSAIAMWSSAPLAPRKSKPARAWKRGWRPLSGCGARTRSPCGARILN